MAATVANPTSEGEALPQSSPFAHRSRRIEQAGKLALIVVANFLDRERVFALAQQQELVGSHPHDFVGCGEPAGGDVPADAFRGASTVRIATANRETMEACQKRANKARETLRCRIRIASEGKR